MQLKSWVLMGKVMSDIKCNSNHGSEFYGKIESHPFHYEFIDHLCQINRTTCNLNYFKMHPSNN